MNKKTKLLAGLIGSLFIAGSAIAQVTESYLQTFDNSEAGTSVTAIGWNWAPSDGAWGEWHTGGRQIGYMSTSAGIDGDPGFAYQYTDALLSSVIWTASNLAQSDLETFSVFVGNSNDNAQVRFLIRVGDVSNQDWYVSTASSSNNVGGAGNFQADAAEFSLNFSDAGANWASLTYDGLQSGLSSGFENTNAFTALSDPLPSGNITAIGVYMHGGQTFSSVRVDNFGVTVIPEPGTLALVAMALGSLLFFRRRR